MVRSILQWNSAWTALILLYCLFFTHPFCKASGSQCFTNEGNLVDVDFPCNPTQNESFCCGAGWACLPNRLCAWPATDERVIRLARGSCTSRSWASTSQCPSFCLDTLKSRNGGTLVTQCDDPSIYCCAGSSCNCTTGEGTIKIPGGSLPFTTVGVRQSVTLEVSSQSTMTLPATEYARETERMTERTTEGTTERITETVTETVSPTAGQSSSETSSTSTEPSFTNTLSIAEPLSNNRTAEASPESKEGIKIGVAVGVSLGVLIIAFIGIFGFWRERRLKEYMEDLKSRWIPVETYMNQGGLGGG